MKYIKNFNKYLKGSYKESIFKKCKKYVLHFSISAYLMLESHPALAFAGVFTGKLKELFNSLVIIGKACVAVSLVAALFKFLTNQGGNWKWIGSICGVGCSLIGINTLVQFFGGS